MQDDAKIALMMLGDTIDFYDDNGDAVDKAYDDGVEEVVAEYNLAIKTIRRRYDVAMKLIGGK